MGSERRFRVVWALRTTPNSENEGFRLVSGKAGTGFRRCTEVDRDAQFLILQGNAFQKIRSLPFK